MLDVRTGFIDTPNGVAAVHRQEIDAGLLAHLRERYDTSLQTPTGDMMQVASIPVIVVERWMREGFDIYAKGITPREVVRRLKAEGLDAFLTTKRRV